MAKCELCGCTAFIKNGDCFICKSCGTQYKKDDLLKEKTQTPYYIEETIIENKKDNSNAAGCFIAILVMLIAISLSVILPNIDKIKDKFDNNNNTSTFTEITKKAPTVTSTQTLNGFDYKIFCNDDYSLVELTIEVYDKNNNILHTETLQGRNYTQGNTYVLSYEMPLNLILKAENVKCSVSKYK